MTPSCAVAGVENKTSALAGSSVPERVFKGYCEILSAPLILRTFFHKVFESIPDGRPEITTVRMAFGSVGMETLVALGCLGLFFGVGAASS